MFRTLASRLRDSAARAAKHTVLRRAVHTEPSPKPESDGWQEHLKLALVYGGTFSVLFAVDTVLLNHLERRYPAQPRPDVNLTVNAGVSQDAEANPEVLTWLACLKTKPAELSACQAEWKAVLQRPRSD